MENSFEGKTDILLEWDAIGFLGHLLTVPFDKPFRLLHVCHEPDVREAILSIQDNSLLPRGVILRKSCLFLPWCASKKEVVVI